MTKVQMMDTAAQWQRCLQLQDWEIEVYPVRRKTLYGKRCVATVEADWETRQAGVTVATKGRTDAQISQSICHELLHLAIMELEEAGKLATSALRDGRVRKAIDCHVEGAAERLVHRLERAFASG